MKWITVLLFLPIKALALPVANGDLNNIFKDSENPALIYYIPDTVSIKLNSKGVPEFALAYWEPSRNQKFDGEVIVTYELTKSEILSNKLNVFRDAGYEFRIPEVQLSSIDSRAIITNRPEIFHLDSEFTIGADLTDAREIVNYFKHGYTNFYLFILYFRIPAVTPKIKGTAHWNEAEIKKYFLAETNGDPVSETEIHYLLYRSGAESNTWQVGTPYSYDSQFLLNKYLIEKYFVKRSDSKYILNLSLVFEDKDQKLEFDGEYPATINKVIVLTNELEGRNDLFNYIKE